MQWISASGTHPGNVRGRNEDAVFCSSKMQLWAVADGMGGHNAGDYASEKIAQGLAQVELVADLSESVDRIEDCLYEINDHLRYHAKANCQGQTVGSTVVVLVTQGSVGVVLWAGDSRLYQLRKRELRLITRDHNPVADLLDVGEVTEQQAMNADTHVITRAIGGALDLHLDVAVFDVLAGDTFMLCSDGLYREVETEVVSDALKHDACVAVETLMDAVLAGQAKDNVSLVVAKAT